MSQSRLSIIPSSAVSDDSLTATQLRVLCAIGSFTGKDQSAYPKQTTIAEAINVSRETVNRAVKVLKAKGYITVQHQYRDDGGQGANLYYVVLDPRDAKITPPVTDSSQSDPSVTPHVISKGHTPCDPTASHLRTIHTNDTDTDVSVSAREGGAPVSHIQAAYDLFVQAAKCQPMWSVPQKLTKPRQSKLKARLKEHGGLRGWEQIIHRCQQSLFLTGRTKAPFSLDIDFLLTPSKLQKVVEGKYDDRTTAHAGQQAHRNQRPAESGNAIDRLTDRLAGRSDGQDIGRGDGTRTTAAGIVDLRQTADGGYA